LRSATSLISTILRLTARAGCGGLFATKASNPLRVPELQFYLKFIRQRGGKITEITVPTLSQKLNKALHW